MRPRLRTLIVLALALALPLAAGAEPGKHDGTWNVVLVCPPHNADDDDAKGYTHRFSAEVNEGRLRGTHGTEGQPGWHFLHGRIHPDGEAALRLDGIVNNPKYAINDAQRGKAYSYRVKATFDEKSGRGERMTGRACEFRFTRP